MRTLAFLAAAAALAACGPAQAGPPRDVPTLEPRNENAIRVYRGTLPRCGFRDLGNVSGRTYRDLQSAAYRMHANAVILDAQNAAAYTGWSGMAIAFTRADCQQ